MSKESLNDKKIVITGEFLGVVEEFLPDKQSTFIKEGQIYATKSGLININSKERKLGISTCQEDDRKVVKVGDVVIGVVLFLRKFSIGMRIYLINKKVHFNSSSFGNVHVSQISNKYVEKIPDAFQITDILRAKVIEQNYNEYKLSTSGKNLGVIYADCVICGKPLNRIRPDKLRCERCGNVETRKLSEDYRDIKEKLRF